VVHYAPAAIYVPKNTNTILFLHGVPSKYQTVNYVATKVADKLLSVSKSIVDGWDKLFSTGSGIEVLYNAVDSDLFFPKNLEKNIDILYLGRLIEIKGVQHLIEAVSILKKQNTDISLTIAGTGPYKEELEKIVQKHGLEKSVEFYGYVKEEDKNDLYNKSKICVFPSYAKEGVLTTMLEAAATETAIITSNCCGMIDFMVDNHNGLLFEPQNPHDLSQKIKVLLEDNAQGKDLARHARMDILSDWTWSKHAEKFVKIINRLIS